MHSQNLDSGATVGVGDSSVHGSRHPSRSAPQTFPYPACTHDCISKSRGLLGGGMLKGAKVVGGGGVVPKHPAHCRHPLRLA